jgi:hypothetical protein
MYDDAAALARPGTASTASGHRLFQAGLRAG